MSSQMNSIIFVLLCTLVVICYAGNPYNIGCGGSFYQPLGEIAGIIGGMVARPYSWPWQVLILKNGNQHCGGTVISNQWILTASHCIFEASGARVPDSSLTVKIEVFNRKDPNDGRVLPIYASYTHPQYKKGGLMSNDIALIKLQTSQAWTQKFQPVCLPQQYQSTAQIVTGKLVTVTGWGDTIVGGGMYPDLLNQVNVNIYDYATCNNAYTAEYSAGIFQYSQFCAAASGKDSCSGDSGGPLVRLAYHPSLKANRWYQFGVVSFGGNQARVCDNPTLPGVYTRISYYCAWIQQIVGFAVCS